MCPICKDSIEDEYHFLMICPYYDEERKKLLTMYNNGTTLHKTSREIFNVLLSCPDPISVHLGQYIYNAMQKRSRALTM